MKKRLTFIGVFIAIFPIVIFIGILLLTIIIPGCLGEGSWGKGCHVLGSNISGLLAFIMQGSFYCILLGIPIGIIICFFSSIAFEDSGNLNKEQEERQLRDMQTIKIQRTLNAERIK